MLSHIRIVLVETTHPGNIGSAARAMKTMGLSQLVLVNPQKFPHAQATAMAAGADDCLAEARIVETFEAAIADCQLVMGASARLRSIPWPMQSPREAAQTAAAIEKTDQIAIVFGREHSGLRNEELQQCHFHIYIDSNPEYGSLNLAAAVQILCYELRNACLEPAKKGVGREVALATVSETEQFYTHLHASIVKTGFLNPDNPGQVMARLRRLFSRARLDKMELSILRGILSSILTSKNVEQ